MSWFTSAGMLLMSASLMVALPRLLLAIAAIVLSAVAVLAPKRAEAAWRSLELLNKFARRTTPRKPAKPLP